jgi:hypothetical protein
VVWRQLWLELQHYDESNMEAIELNCSRLVVHNKKGEPGILLECSESGPEVILLGESNTLMELRIDRGRPRLLMETVKGTVTLIIEESLASLFIGKPGTWPTVRVRMDLDAMKVEIETQSDLKIVKVDGDNR